MGQLKDGRHAVITTTLWYTAREALCRYYGVGHDAVNYVRVVPKGFVIPGKSVTLQV